MSSILHFSTADTEGGSARSAYRIHTALRERGHASRMLVGTKYSTDPDVETVHGGGWGRIKDRVAEEITSRIGLQYLYYPSASRVLRHPWVRGSDVVQLFNTHGGYFTHRAIPWLSRRVPVVWRLSDMWPVTGHCAYAGECELWRTGCRGCGHPQSYPPLRVDTSALLWKIKRRVYARSDFTVVAPSSWIEAIARESPLFARKTVVRIPNGIDTSVFRSPSRTIARQALGLPRDGQLVLFVAHVLDNNPRKGAADFLAAMQTIPPREDLAVVAVGYGGDSWHNLLHHRVITTGLVRDDRLLALIYSACDLTVIPSRVENLPNNGLESMACGTPVVAYDTGGVKDAVRPDISGALVARGDVRALSTAIRELLSADDRRVALGTSAQAMVNREFTREAEASSFLQIYADLLAERRKSRRDSASRGAV